MPDIKLVLTDFDGTVVQFGKHEVSEQVREAVVACENRGIRMVPITGRSYEMAHSVLEILGFEDLGVFDNGATIQNCKTGEIVWSQWLELGTLKQVARLLAPMSKAIDYSQSGDQHEPDEAELARIDRLSEPVSSVYAAVHETDVAKATEQLNAIPDITFYWAVSTNEAWPQYRGVQVTHKLADKFHGANALRKIIGIPKEHTLAIGDGENDFALFENAGLNIAMGNATEGLKAKADYVVGSVAEDGFVAAMERFVLN